MDSCKCRSWPESAGPHDGICEVVSVCDIGAAIEEDPPKGATTMVVDNLDNSVSFKNKLEGAEIEEALIID